MKKNFIYLLWVLGGILASCEPIENRDSIGNSITAEQLNISATSLIVDGKRSNKIVLENHSPVLSFWDYGTGNTRKQSDSILMVIPGDHEIVFTGYNPDGSAITKTLNVTVDELTFDVPPQYGLLCGTGTKTWMWRTTSSTFGNGGYLSDKGPAWWALTVKDLSSVAPEGEMIGSSFTLTLSGSKMVKDKSDGTSIEGKFELDLTQKLNQAGSTSLWSMGKLKTTVSVPCGILPNHGKREVMEYDIVQLEENKLVLACPEPGAGAWGTCWFWVFVNRN